MRVLKFLVSSLLVVGVVAVIGALVARELLLVWGVAAVRAEMNTLRKLAAKPSQYTSQCLQKGAQPDVNLQIIESFQLRFLNDTEYVVEVVCRQFKLDPIRISDGTLPLFVKKTPGSSGLKWGDESSAVELEVYGRHRTILVEDKNLFYEKPGVVTLGEGPVGICAGYGFACCPSETTQGLGDQLSGVTDCPRSCYSQCVSRPTILSFSSNPFMDPQSRVAEAQAGEVVTFSYVSDLANAQEPEITLDFGDGSQEVLREAIGSTTHTYACTQQLCQYQAKLGVRTEDGRTSADLPVTVITLQVRP